MPSVADAPSPRPVVLIADDDQDLCGMLSLWLGREYELLLAFDGDNALTLAHRCRPEAALVDVMMPRLSGFGLAWAFQHHPRLRGVKLAFMTAYPQVEGTMPQGYPLLRKPFEKGRLEGVLRRLLQERQPGAGEPPGRVEQRRTERADVAIGGNVHRSGIRVEGSVLSLSLLGAFFRCEEPLPVGSSWTLSFGHEGVSYEIPVQVVHGREHGGMPGVGLCMHDLGLDGERRIEALLDRLLSRG